MQAVGQLVGLGPHQTGLGLVHGPVEHLLGDPCQLLREVGGDIGEDGVDKGTAAADDILVEAALALVDAHGYAAGEHGVVVAGVSAQLIEGVAPLVNDGVHGGHQIVFVVVGGDAHIVAAEVVGEGVLRLGNGAVGPINAHNLHQVVAEMPLLLNGVVLHQEAVVDLGLFADFLHQGHNGAAQPGKEDIQGFLIHALLVFIQQGIIGGHVGVVVTRKFAAVGHDLFQIRRKSGKIVGGLCLMPDGIRLVQKNAVVHIFPGGDAAHPVVVLFQNLQLPGLDGGEFRSVGGQVVIENAVARVGGQVIADSSQHLHGFPPGFPGALRGGGGGVLAEDAHGVVVGKQSALELFQGFQGLGKGCIFHLVCFLSKKLG